jgi:hypothetical protein
MNPTWPKLKTCPACAAEAAFCYGYDGPPPHAEQPDFWFVGCVPRCGYPAKGYPHYRTREEAAKEWNEIAWR